MTQKAVLSLPGVDFTKLFRKAKSRRRTAFGEKFAIQFHQKLNSLNSQSKFGKNSPNAIRQKRRRILRANISPNAIRARTFRAQMLMKSTPGVSQNKAMKKDAIVSKQIYRYLQFGQNMVSSD
jgi:hypothetical protein